MSAPETADSGPPQQIRLTRRQMLQTTAAAGGAAALGTGAVDTPLTATQDAEAGVFTAGVLLGAGAAVGLGVVGGMALERWKSEDVDIDEDDLSDDRMTQTYEVATLINDGFDDYRTISANEFGDNDSGTSNTFNDAAWSEVRTTAVRGIQENWSPAKAKRRAGQKVDKQATRFFLNHIQLWNRRVEAFYPYMADDIKDSNKDTIYVRDDDYNETSLRNDNFDPSTVDKWEGVSVDDTLVGMKTTAFDLPWDPTKFDKWDQEDVAVYIPWNLQPPLPNKFQETGVGYPGLQGQIFVTHDDYDKIYPFKYDQGFGKYLNEMASDYDQIKSDINTYIDTVYDAVSQGAVSEIQTLSPRDLIQEFAGASKMERETAELAAAGLYSPKEAGGVVAKVSHRDLSADSLWGRLFIRFKDGYETTIEPGTEIRDNSYQMAYLIYQDRTSNEPETALLDGNVNLEILDVSGEGIDQGENVDNNTEDDGTVPIWNPDQDGETPAWIKKPPAGETIVVETEKGTYHFDPKRIKQRDDGTYVIPDTQIPPGERIKKIRAVGKLSYVQPIENVPDPTTVDQARLTDRYGNISYFRDKVREETRGGGPGVGGDWINEIIGFFGGIKNAVIAAVVAVVGASVVGALRG